MKEIEEKAKRYDEALKVAREYWDSPRTCIDINVLPELFSELKESEDEKIRKALIKLVKKVGEGYENVIDGVSIENAIFWLEKQGEHANFRNKIQIGDKVTRNEDGVLVNLSQLNRVAKKQGEQKSYISETMNEKGDIDNGFTRMIEKEQKPIPKFKVGDEIRTKNEESLIITRIDRWGYWSEDLFICNFDDADKWELVEQKPAEWSEEDEHCRHQLIVFCENCMVQDSDAKKCANWLKSLRLQSQWKPSVAQIEALNYVVNLMASSESPKENDYYYNVLKDLREQLKKL